MTDSSKPTAIAQQSLPFEPVTNPQIAAQLEEVAERLAAQGANPFRVRAYHSAAETLRRAGRPVREILASEGTLGLERLPGIGRSLSHAIAQLVRTGRFSLLERLRGDDAAEAVFATIGSIGPKIARRIHETLEIETLAELEAAAFDGRLAKVPGMGTKRLRAVQESLAGRFRRQPSPPRPRRTETAAAAPPVAELLEIDREYRRLAAADRAPAPRPAALHGALFQYGSSSRTGHDARLGRHLPRRPPRRWTMDGRDGDVRQITRPPHRPRP